jgi:hypothetical protein
MHQKLDLLLTEPTANRKDRKHPMQRKRHLVRGHRQMEPGAHGENTRAHRGAPTSGA